MRVAGLSLLFMLCFVTICARAQAYPAVRPLHRTFEVPDVGKANISLDIKSVEGVPLYKLQCHSAGYTADPDFDYSGDFECRLSSIREHDTYSTLLTEDAHQSRDWESRGRFFSADLRGVCAHVPEFGANRNFKLRGMRLTLQITDPLFTEGGKLSRLKLTVTVGPDPRAQRPIAEIVPLPKGKIPTECKLQEYFVNPAELSTYDEVMGFLVELPTGGSISYQYSGWPLDFARSGWTCGHGLDQSAVVQPLCLRVKQSIKSHRSF